MIIANRYQGPRYATDSTAHDLKRFVASRASHIAPTADRPAGSVTTYTFDELYPSLAVASTTSNPSIFAAIVHGIDAIAIALHLRRGPLAL